LNVFGREGGTTSDKKYLQIVPRCFKGQQTGGEAGGDAKNSFKTRDGGANRNKISAEREELVEMPSRMENMPNTTVSKA
jgi:hypothetical protein